MNDSSNNSNVGDDCGFRGLEIPAIIDTGKDDFVDDFYKPLLTQSVDYKRGVGYFTSGWLASNAQGLASFATNGGKAKWITSPQLPEEDWEALQEGNKAIRDEILYDQLKDRISSLEKDLEEDTRNALAWLIAEDILEIRFALPENGLKGEFHDKWGVFTDPTGNRVAFHGSQNDSTHGFTNYESFDIFCDWENEREADRVFNHEQRFDQIWENKTDQIETLTLPESIKKDIIDLRETSKPPYSETGNSITLRDYQADAVEAWEENNRRGMLEMATGTGKTYTAIGAMDKLLSKREEPLVTIIAVPFTHLADQWAESLSDWGFTQSKMLYGSVNSEWKSDLTRLLSDVSIGVRDQVIIITTHTTFTSDFFKKQITSTDVDSLLVADEVHGLGSEHRRTGLLNTIDYRLGLSATPRRYYDDEGTEALENFFEGVIFEYTLEDAIPEHLTEYKYYPHIVEMTDEELAEYSSLSRKLVAEMNKDHSDEELIERLLMKRAGLIKSAEQKLAKLQSIIQSLEKEDATDHLLVYTNHQQIDSAQRILNSEGLVQHRFTNEEDDEERKNLLDGFDEGRYDALVAMKCLDEGVDVPSTRRAILMSNSQNPKQFIQRRGRVLRKHEESGKEFAEIHDMIVVPSLNPNRDIIESERNILKREIQRFEEFAELAENRIEAKNRIQPLRTKYEI